MAFSQNIDYPDKKKKCINMKIINITKRLKNIKIIVCIHCVSVLPVINELSSTWFKSWIKSWDSFMLNNAVAEMNDSDYGFHNCLCPISSRHWYRKQTPGPTIALIALWMRPASPSSRPPASTSETETPCECSCLRYLGQSAS